MRSLGPLLVIVFVLVRIISAAMSAAKKSATHEAQTSETAEQQRMREVQERIRRKIAERRGGVAPLAPAEAVSAERDAPPPMLSAPSVPQLDPFGGPMRRLSAQLERRVRQAAPEPASEPTTTAVLYRQEQLADQLRGLEDTRLSALRRATEVAATAKGVAESHAGVRAVARGELLADLRDGRSLRRAFVLREILGAPVGLR